MGQEQSNHLEFSNLLSRTSKGYDSIPDHKPKIMAIFDDLSLPIVSLIIENISKNLEVTVVSYRLNKLSLESSRYQSISESFDNVEKLVFFSILENQNKSARPFSSDGCFSGFFKYLLATYPEYRRYGQFALCLMCKDFTHTDLPLTMIYDNGCTETMQMKIASSISNYYPKHRVTKLYADSPNELVKDHGHFWWVYPFSCKYTEKRFYLGNLWFDKDAFEEKSKIAFMGTPKLLD